jgi:PAS domain S-box-containing protein
LVEVRRSHLAAIVMGSDHAIISGTLEGVIDSWNPGAARLFGYHAKEIIGRPMSVLVPEKSKTRIPRILARLRRGESLERYEMVGLHKNGHAITIAMTISPVRDGGQAIIGVAAIVRDITEQRRTEMALRESEERFRVALKSAPTVVFNHDRDLRYTWINSPLVPGVMQEWVGHTDIELLGREEGQHLAAVKQRVLRTGIGTRTETTVTFQGETRHVDLTVEPLRDHTGACVGLTCAATDITQLKLSLLEQERLITELLRALDEVNLLSGLLSICASCKRIKDEQNSWQPLESYIQSRSEAKFTHGLCPDCLHKLYPHFYPA